MSAVVGSQWVDNITLCFNQDYNLTITNILSPGKNISFIEIQNITCSYSTESLGSSCSCQMSCLLDLRVINTTTGETFLYIEDISCDEQQLEEFLNTLTSSTEVNSLSATFISVSIPSLVSNSTDCIPPGQFQNTV